MKNRFALAACVPAMVGGALAVSLGACKDDSSNPAWTTPDTPADAAPPPDPWALGVPCTDTIDSVYADPGTLPDTKGAILRCAPDGAISQADLYAKAQANVSRDQSDNSGYDGKPFTTGVHVYRVLFRTERGDTAKSAGYSSAKVFVPDTPRAAQLPAMVGARGSRGQAAACAASKEDPAADAVNHDYRALAWEMAGLGYAIIVPDLAGYANFGAPGNPVSGYAAAEDVAKGTLDGARALRKMFPNAFTGDTVIVGHSQGGHSALSSLALAHAYAPDLHIAAVATYAPLWYSQRTWGALMQVAPQYPLATQPTPTAVSVWYHYTHGELLDGPGHGVDVFKPEVQGAIKSFVENDCWGAGDNQYPELAALGTTALDIFDTTFVEAVRRTEAFGTDCDPTDALCAKWTARYLADRPHLDATAANVPLLVAYGGKDTTITPDRMKCALDRLDQDHSKYTLCVDPDHGHGGTVRTRGAYVADWIAARTLGEAEPAPCGVDFSSLKDPNGDPWDCAAQPPND